jgi:hypothetical protein
MPDSDRTVAAGGGGRACLCPYLLAALTLPLLALSAGPLFAHPDSPASPPLAPSAFRLQYRKPAEIVALFARERLPEARGDHVPRAARIDETESLVPNGVDAVLRAEDADPVMLVGTEGVDDLRSCIAVLDAPLERIATDREKVVLTLRRADAPRLRAAVLRLSETRGSGPSASAALQGRRLVLEGSPAWLHRALRQVIRAELKEPEGMGLPAP